MNTIRMKRLLSGIVAGVMVLFITTSLHANANELKKAAQEIQTMGWVGFPENLHSAINRAQFDTYLRQAEEEDFNKLQALFVDVFVELYGDLNRDAIQQLVKQEHESKGAAMSVYALADILHSILYENFAKAPDTNHFLKEYRDYWGESL